MTGGGEQPRPQNEGVAQISINPLAFTEASERTAIITRLAYRIVIRYFAMISTVLLQLFHSAFRNVLNQGFA